MTHGSRVDAPHVGSDAVRNIHAYWRAANYLSVGQIYLYDNQLLRQPLTREHIKLRLLGHWGTTRGLNFIYVHLNRVIKDYDLNVIYVTGPGHGGPAMVANAYLEWTYSEIYPEVSPSASWDFLSCYEAFVHIADSMFNQHAKWLEACNRIEWRRPIPNSLQRAVIGSPSRNRAMKRSRSSTT